MSREVNKVGLIRVFDRIAATYDEIGPPFYRHFAERLVKAAAVPLDSRMLDLGTGCGAVLIAAAGRAGAQGEAVGVDLSAGMLREARKRVQELGLKQAQLIRMNAASLDFPDRSFDRVLCGFGIGLFADPLEALRESHRVLCRGGRICLTSWARDCAYIRWVFEELDCKLEPPKEAVDTHEGLGRLLERAGFDEIRIWSEEQSFDYADEREWWESLWTYCFRVALEGLDARTLATVKPRILSRVRLFEHNGRIRVRLRAFFAVASRPQ